MNKQKNMNRMLYHSLAVVLLFSCVEKENPADAYGNFQTIEILIASEVSGKIISKNFEEGGEVTPGEIMLVIDTAQWVLQRQELLAKKEAAQARKINIRAQVDVQQRQKETLEKDLKRFEAMLEDGAATPKQVDDIEGNISVLEKQVASIRTNLLSIDADILAIAANIARIEDMIARSRVTAPKEGTVLESYIEVGEVAGQGKPLFKMADLQNMELLAYISGDQLSQVTLGQEVHVKFDGKNERIDVPGKITWISSNAEFTPKNIQTREERVNQVYAMKVSVKNSDGRIKINMPGEVYFREVNSTEGQ